MMGAMVGSKSGGVDKMMGAMVGSKSGGVDKMMGAMVGEYASAYPPLRRRNTGEELEAGFEASHGAGSESVAPRASPTSSVQERVMRLMQALADTGELLGAQACLIVNGKVLVDAAAGQLGVVDPRPVRSESLFQLFGAGSSLLATLALSEAQRGALRLDAPVAAVWHAFGAAGKEQLTLAQLLSHQTGLAGVAPDKAPLREICDMGAMTKVVAAAREDEAALREAHAGMAVHEGLPWGWALAGVLEASSQLALETLLERRLTRPLGLQHELALRLPWSELGRVAKHTAVPLMKDAGLDVAELLASGLATPKTTPRPGVPPAETAPQGDRSHEGPPSAPSATAAPSAPAEPEGIDFGKLQGLKQLDLLSTFNMKRLITSVLPGASAHGSAHGLAQFYAALTAGKLGVPSALLAQAQQLAQPGKGPAGEPVRFGLGFQVGSCVEVAKVQGIEVSALVRPLDKFLEKIDKVDRTHKLFVLGHAAVGGTIGFCVPDRKVALAVTVSKLTPNKVAVKKLVELMMGEVGLGSPSGFW